MTRITVVAIELKLCRSKIRMWEVESLSRIAWLPATGPREVVDSDATLAVSIDIRQSHRPNGTILLHSYCLNPVMICRV